VRPLEQWKVARELRLRIRESLARLGVDAGPPAEVSDPSASAPDAPPTGPAPDELPPPILPS